LPQILQYYYRYVDYNKRRDSLAVFYASKTEIMGSYPTRSTDVCMSSVCTVLLTCRPSYRSITPPRN
jgi:hypothetical protein